VKAQYVAAASWLALVALIVISLVTVANAGLGRVAVPAPGRIEGHVRVGEKPAVGWKVLIGRSSAASRRHFAALATTGTGGEFNAREMPGRYVMGAERPNGKLCGMKRVMIPPTYNRTVVQINCAK
jgi:hypothetical protein